MSNRAAIARANASACEAILYAFRKTKDGTVVSFVIHPQEIPDAIALAAIGSRWQLAMVELDDDDGPKQSAAEPVPEEEETGASAHTVAPEKRVVQRIAIACKEPSFWRFLSERGVLPITNEDEASDWVRIHCRVGSRAALATDAQARHRAACLLADYAAWQLAPEVVET